MNSTRVPLPSCLISRNAIHYIPFSRCLTYSVAFKHQIWWLYFCRGGGLVTKLYLTFVTPWTVAHQAPLSMENLVCCSPWGCKELDTTEQLNWTELASTQRWQGRIVSLACYVKSNFDMYPRKPEKADLIVNVLLPPLLSQITHLIHSSQTLMSLVSKMIFCTASLLLAKEWETSKSQRRMRNDTSPLQYIQGKNTKVTGRTLNQVLGLSSTFLTLRNEVIKPGIMAWRELPWETVLVTLTSQCKLLNISITLTLRKIHFSNKNLKFITPMPHSSLHTKTKLVHAFEIVQGTLSY